MMTIKEHIAGMKQKLQKLQQKRNILIKVQTFKFKPFSKKQKQVFTWWVPNSPVKEKDGMPRN